ncbi:MAG: hypothetical protein J6Y60_03390 [Treponema sp.]|nr:hypothetical protein [Treponema sp.]
MNETNRCIECPFVGCNTENINFYCKLNGHSVRCYKADFGKEEWCPLEKDGETDGKGL